MVHTGKLIKNCHYPVLVITALLYGAMIGCCVLGLKDARTFQHSIEETTLGQQVRYPTSVHYIITLVTAVLGIASLVLFVIHELKDNYHKCVKVTFCAHYVLRAIVQFLSFLAFGFGIGACVTFGKAGVQGTLLITAIVTCVGGALAFILNLLGCFLANFYVDYEENEDDRQVVCCPGRFCCCFCCYKIGRRRRRRPFYKPEPEKVFPEMTVTKETRTADDELDIPLEQHIVYM